MPGEERKVATVVFGDLVGSTEVAASHDPERTRAMLDSFYEAMASEIAGAGGTIEKFVGDAVMAAFGAPAAQEDHAERALHTALSMRRRLAELFGGTLALRIGVNTGEVVAGQAREGGSFVTGEAVNIAARLEQAAAPGEILVGERTAVAARGAFEFDAPITVEAKGKPGGVVARRLVRALSLMRPRGVGVLHRTFVGRESELELLRATYARAAREEEPHLVTIVGDAGVGKTRLIRELWEWLGSGSPEPLRMTGRCLSYGRAITYWPLGEILKEHLGLLESDPPEVALRRLAGREILGLTLGLDVASDLHPLAARERLHEAWVEFVEGLIAERPVAVLIEDLHWAEEPLLDLLERVLGEVRGPLLLLGTARPEFLDRRPASSGGRRNAATLWLEPLSAADTERMLGEALAAELPEHVRDVIVGRAEGNPFFVEELLATLIDRGVLRRTSDGWSAGELPSDLEIPDSIQAVLAARIDLLAPAEKAALQAAAVIGRIFWAGPVRQMLEGAEPDFAALEGRDFVRRRSGSSILGEREFAIKHALTREVAYASLPRARRARLHAAFAEWIERAGERQEHASLLAHHYAEAVRPEDADLAWAGEEAKLGRLRAIAGDWLRRAAELAVGRYEIDEALGLLHRALELEESEESEAELWREIGRAHALKFDGEAFWTAMQRSLAVCRDRRACAEAYSELVFQTGIRSGMWKRQPDRELVERWIERAHELAEPESPARAKALMARSYWDPYGDPEAAREASELAERLGDVELQSYAWDARRLAAFRAGQYDEASAWAERRFELLDRISDPDHVAQIYESAIPGYVGSGRFGEARRLASLHDEVAGRLTPHHRLHGVAFLLQVDELAADWQTIRTLRPRAELAVTENLATPCVLNSRSLLVCALANAHLGDEQEAARLERRADELGMEGYGPTLAAPRTQLALLRGEVEKVERLLAEPVAPRGHTWYSLAAMAARLDALAALRDGKRAESEATPLVRAGTYLEPFALRALGVVRGDESLIEAAAGCFDAMGLTWHSARTRALLG